MSLITRCPECATLFKVVQDQLRISDGWVRCGQCGHVFDGAANLLEVMANPQEEAELQQHQHSHAPSALPPDTANVQTLGQDQPKMPAAAPHAIAPPAAAPVQPDITVDALAADDPIVMEPSASWHGDEVPSVLGLDAAALQAHEPQPEPSAEVPNVGFVRAARRKAFWQRRKVRWTLAGLNMLLLLGLVAQVALQQRDRLAAMEPQTKPWLQQACQSLGCTVSVPKNIEAVVVDSSAFNAARGDVYRFQVSLRNTGTLETALPALELSLTDSRDDVMLRRVLLPKDFSNAVPALSAGGEWSGSLAVLVPASALPARITGYKVLAFYP